MSHPNSDQLHDFALGNLPATDTEAIATHIDQCPDCAQTVAQFDDSADTLVSQLAGSVPEGPFAGESALHGALAFVKAIGREPSQTYAAATVANRAAVPSPLGRLREYELLAKLGEGGMGAVYKARHTKLDKIVALKVLPADRMRSAEAVSRFEREMRAVGKLDHPHIVRATDAGEVEGTHFLVMEYVAGCDLSELVKQHGPLAVADACELVRQAALGLAYAHDHGLVHRDIKPSNLMLAVQESTARVQVTRDRRQETGGTIFPHSAFRTPHSALVKILDLGLALLADEPTTGRELTSSGQMMGTVDYMAPEQAHSSHTVDARADLYSLGATLYKLLTGTAPFSGPKYQSNVQKLIGIATEQPIPVTTHRPDVPAPLSQLIDRLLAKYPTDRPTSAAQVAAMLSPFCTTANLSLLPLPPGEGGRRPGEGSAHSQTSPTSGTLSFSPSPPLSVSPSQLPLPLGDGRGEGAGRRPFLLSLALASLAALVLCGVWIIIKDKDGKEKARYELATGDRLEVTESGSGKSPSLTPTGPFPPLAVAPFDAKQARAHQEAWAKYLGTTVESANSVGAKMILVPPGEFLMGSTEEQIAAALKMLDQEAVDSQTKARFQKDESPQRRVVITRPLLIGAIEVTIGQFKQFAADAKYLTEAEREKAQVTPDSPPKRVLTYLSSGYPSTDDSPAALITRNDALAFCKWLSAKEDVTYRLPSEAEWEYACRAGTTTLYLFGDDVASLEQHAWYSKNSASQWHQVATKPANPFGLFDMHGNVWEWCQDSYSETWYQRGPVNDPVCTEAGPYKVLRGGAWGYNAFRNRAAYRHPNEGSYRSVNYGFRVVREVDLPKVAVSSQVAKVDSPAAKSLDIPKTVGGTNVPTPATFTVPNIQGGAPLSSLALIVRPAPLPGVKSWSIETAGSRGSVNAVVFSPDGTLLAAASEDGAIRIWDVEKEELVRVLIGHQFEPRALAWAADVNQLFSASRHEVISWDPVTGRHLNTLWYAKDFRPQRAASIWPDAALAVNNNGSLVAVGREGGTVKLYNFIDGTKIAETPLHARTVEWSADGKRLLVGSHGHGAVGVWVWNVESRSIEWQIDARGPARWSSDEMRVAYPQAGQLHVYNLEMQKVVGQWKPAGMIETIAWLPAGNGCLVGTNEDTYLIDLSDPTPKKLSDSPGDGCLAVHRGTQRVAIVSRARVDGLRVFDSRDWKVPVVLSWKSFGESASGPIFWSADNSFFALGNNDPGDFAAPVSLWQIGNGSPPSTIHVAGAAPCSTISCSPNGNRLFAAGFYNGGNGSVYDTQSGNRIFTINDNKGAITVGSAWSPNGKSFAICGRNNGSIRVYDGATGALLREKKPFKDGFDCYDLPMAWIPGTETLVLTLRNGQEIFWDLKTDNVTVRKHGVLTRSSFSPDGLWQASTNSQGPILINTNAQEVVRTSNHVAHGVRWLADTGILLAVGYDDTTGQPVLWHLDGKKLTTLKSFPGILPGEFTADGRLLASRGGAAFHVWDTATGKPFSTFVKIKPGNDLVLAPDGHRLPCGIDDELRYVALLDDGTQQTYTPAEFAAKFGWKNDPSKVKLGGMEE